MGFCFFFRLRWRPKERKEEEEVDFFGLPLLFFFLFDSITKTTLDFCGLPIAMMTAHSPSSATC